MSKQRILSLFIKNISSHPYCQIRGSQSPHYKGGLKMSIQGFKLADNLSFLIGQVNQSLQLIEG